MNRVTSTLDPFINQTVPQCQNLLLSFNRNLVLWCNKMPELYQSLIQKAYTAFNARDIDTIFSLMHGDVLWPNGWEGGYLKGENEVRDYWTRQWQQINPTVIPIGITQRKDGRIEVNVHQTVKDLDGKVLLDGMVNHIYTIENGLITHMEIETA